MSQPETLALSEQHRQAQLTVRSSALRAFLALWPIWNGDTSSFAQLVQAVLPLARVYRQSSAAIAGVYYESIRNAQEVPGRPAVRLAATVTPKQIATSMYVTGQAMTRDALAAGQTAEQARRAALTRVSGAVTRHVLNGGRQTIIDSVAADKQAHGWARITDGQPCAFCAMLAGRGAVYKTEQTADFEAHDHCGCQAIPLFNGSPLPPLNRKLRDLYNQAQREAEAAGELDRGTSNDRLNAFRRLYEAEHLSLV